MLQCSPALIMKDGLNNASHDRLMGSARSHIKSTRRVLSAAESGTVSGP